VLTNRADIRFENGSGFQLTISVRNCCNEFGSRCRIDNVWYGRDGDPPIPGSWPVLAVGSERIGLLELQQSEQTNLNLVTGLPVVIAGEAVTRVFLMANASDVAHAFRVDPRERFGPPAPAWQELTDGWVNGKVQKLSDPQLAERIQAIADRHGAEPSDRLLHSILGQRADGSLILVGIHGALDQIGRWLVKHWNVTKAFVLDNSGSVGWSYREPGDNAERLLLAGPNQRSKGTVFLALDVGGHLRASAASGLTHDWDL